MKFMLLLPLLLGLQVARACPFDGLSLSHIEDSPDFKVVDLGPVAFPQELLMPQTEILGDFSPQACRKAFIAERITDRTDGQTYTAFRSNHDECDGGNSYGVLVRGTQPDPRQAIATIEDSDFWCF